MNLRLLARAGRGMAAGTLASRVTGFLRVLVMAAALGLGGQLLDSYNVANSIPNAVYSVVFGGATATLVIPLLSRATVEHRDGGVAYAQRLLSLLTCGLGAVVLLSILLAPLLVDLYTPGFTPRQRDLAVVFSRFFLPQILFYGVGAAAAAVLNARGRFAAPTWAPAVNNLVMVGVGLTYLAVGGSSHLETLSGSQLLLLAIGTTAGVLCQMALVVWALARDGFPLRFRLDVRGLGLRRIARLGTWVLLSVIAEQGLVMASIRLASTGGPGAVGAYQTAYSLFHVPYAVVALSVMTAVLPHLSRSAARGDAGQTIVALSQSLRLVLVITAPLGAVMCALGPQLSAVLFAHGKSTASAVALVGATVSAFGLTLIPYAACGILLSGFYATQDTRTPALINTLVSVTGIAGCLLAARTLPSGGLVVGIPIAYAVAYTAGSVVAGAVLRRRLGQLDGRRILTTHVRVAVGASMAGLAAGATAQVVARLVGVGWTGSAATLVAGGLVAAVVYVVAARLFRIAELTHLVAALTGTLASRGGAAAR